MEKNCKELSGRASGGMVPVAQYMGAREAAWKKPNYKNTKRIVTRKQFQHRLIQVNKKVYRRGYLI
jgi:hypothetical protein